MAKLGRPTAAAVTERRSRIMRSMAASLLAQDASLPRFAEHVGVGERTLRADLAAIVAGEVPPPASPVLAPELVRELECAETPEELARFQRRLAVARGSGHVSLADARFLVNACRELGRTLATGLPAAERDAMGKLVQEDGSCAPPLRDPCAEESS